MRINLLFGSLVLGLYFWSTAILHAAAPVITPAPGYSITYDGNDGDFFSTSDPAPAPANLSTAAGSSAFTSGNLGVGPHTTPDRVRDGFYGNSSAWIGDTTTPTYVGVNLGGNYNLNAIAWGRDNGNTAGDCCGGQLTDRSLGTYTVQVTNSVTPDTTSNWTTVGTINYTADDDGVVGGGFTSFLRHQYGTSQGGSPLPATGLRLVVPAGGIVAGTAVDELELYGSAAVQPVPQSGLRSWVKADGDVTTSGTAITRMGDHSFNGNHATPGISPDLVPNAINGLPAAQFNGAVNHLNLPTTTGIANSDYEIFAIAKSSSSNIQFITSGSSTVGEYELHLNGAAGARFIPTNSATPSPDTYADLGVPGQFSDGRTHLFNTRVQGGVGYLRVAGMENGDTVSNATSSFAGIGGNLVTLGVRGDASYSFVGDMGEVLVYNRALSTTERRDVERYLSAKWDAPLNVASQTQGGVAFANELIAGGGYTQHQVDHLNDALYGNSQSWIGNDNGGTNAFAGVKFDDAYNITSLAFGRDATSAFGDRSLGTYMFQFTRDIFDPLNPGAATWTDFLSITYDGSTVNPWLRHEYDFAKIWGVRGVRVLLSNNSIAIDELEVFGVVPEPTSLLLAGMGVFGLALYRRRRTVV